MSMLIPANHAMSRRGFLRGVALAGGALALPRWAWADPAADYPALKWLDPTNAEPDLAKLVASWQTPLENFYIRSHAKTPTIDAAAYRFKVNGLVDHELSFSVEELGRKFAPAEVFATMQCAGNRRSEMSAMKKVGGVQWGSGAISTAKWKGVRLADVLRAAGLKDSAKHVQFTGFDPVDNKGVVAPFGASIPVEKALASEVLLAWGMNDANTLTPEHGFPLRVVVPGVYGVRSVKWLDTITVSAEESPNFFQQKAYKITPPTMDDTNVDWSVGKPLQEMFVNSAIASVAVEAGGKTARARGYAMPTGHPGDAIAKVELSADGGSTWMEAKLIGDDKPFCWRLWEGEIALPAGAKAVIARASTKKGVVQPMQVDWNFKGYCYNASQTRAI